MSHLVLEEAVLQGFVARVAAGALEKQLVLLKVQKVVLMKHQSAFHHMNKMIKTRRDR